MTAGSAAPPSAPVVQTLIDSVSSGALPAGEGIASYLGALAVTSTHSGGAGIANHLAALPVTSVRVGGAGIPNHLGTISQACEASRKQMCLASTVFSVFGTAHYSSQRFTQNQPRIVRKPLLTTWMHSPLGMPREYHHRHTQNGFLPDTRLCLCFILWVRAHSCAVFFMFL
jgi:hypothetical protein